MTTNRIEVEFLNFNFNALAQILSSKVSGFDVVVLAVHAQKKQKYAVRRVLVNFSKSLIECLYDSSVCLSPTLSGYTAK
jgi:hypothetical protein